MIWKSKAFVDLATARRHRGLSTIYIKHNSFHQSKLRRDVDLQNTHKVLFKSPRDVMQIDTLSAQMVLELQLSFWHRDATPVPCGQLLTDFSPRTDDRLNYCTNTGSISSKLYVPECLKQINSVEVGRAKFLYSPSVSIYPPQVQLSSPSVLSKRVHPVYLRSNINLLKGSLQSIKRHRVAKYQSEVWLLSLKNNSEATKRISDVRKSVTAHEI